MNYIYDIFLNFNTELYDFFDWNSNDNMIHIKKIPIYRVSTKVLNDMRLRQIKIEKNRLEEIDNKTELFSRLKNTSLKYAALFTDTEDVLALTFDRQGNSVQRSKLLIDEDIEVLECSSRYKLVNIRYTSKKALHINDLETRRQRNVDQTIFKELSKLYKSKNYETLEYLYYELFNQKERNINIVYSKLKKCIKKYNKQMTTFLDLISQNN
jgi:hypothetical protein